nr:hypothetical protein GCM10017745_16310 [Saccharothrix mutabilis subsp. capreolus]
MCECENGAGRREASRTTKGGRGMADDFAKPPMEAREGGCRTVEFRFKVRHPVLTTTNCVLLVFNLWNAVGHLIF